jgi:hypothetical protein
MVSDLWSRYQNEGVYGLKLVKRGVRKGTNRCLSLGQEAQFQQLIMDKTPDQLKLTFAF